MIKGKERQGKMSRKALLWKLSRRTGVNEGEKRIHFKKWDHLDL